MDFEAQQGRQKRYLEAEKILREVIAEEDKLYLARATEPSARLKELTADPYLANKTRKLAWSAQRFISADGSTGKVSIILTNRARRPEALIALCLTQEAGSLVYTRADGGKEKAQGMVNDYFFKETDGRLVLFDAASRKENPCAKS